MDYIINIYKNDQYLLTVGAKHAAYDNVIWWELNDIINIEDIENLSKEDIISKISGISGYWFALDRSYADWESTDIDIAKHTIRLCETLPIYDLDEEISCIKVLNVEGKYFAEYEDGEKYPMIYITYDNIDLLKKSDLTYEEFAKVFAFIDEIVKKYNDTDFILNEDKVLRLNFA